MRESIYRSYPYHINNTHIDINNNLINVVRYIFLLQLSIRLEYKHYKHSSPQGIGTPTEMAWESFIYDALRE